MRMDSSISIQRTIGFVLIHYLKYTVLMDDGMQFKIFDSTIVKSPTNEY